VSNNIPHVGPADGGLNNTPPPSLPPAFPPPLQMTNIPPSLPPSLPPYRCIFWRRDSAELEEARLPFLGVVGLEGEGGREGGRGARNDN